MMASGWYPNFRSSVSDHHGSRRGERPTYFRSRGRGKEISYYQRDADQSQSDYFDGRSTDIVSGSSFNVRRGRGGRFRGQGRGVRRPYDTRQISHTQDQVDSK